MKEAINSFFIEDGNLDRVEEFIEEDKNEELIYEVIRVIGGIPLFLEDHIERMSESFRLVGLEFPFSNSKIQEYLEELIKANLVKEGNVKLTFNINNYTLKAFFIKHNYPTENMYEDGVKAIIYKGERENPNAKIIKKDFREKVNKKIKEENAYEALLEDKDGYITEGSRSNIFFIKENILVTPPNNKVLKGVTRKKILEIASMNNIEVEERTVNVEEIFNFDAVFMSGTSPKALPINKIEHKIYNTDNLILKKIIKEYDKIIEDYIKNHF